MPAHEIRYRPRLQSAAAWEALLPLCYFVASDSFMTTTFCTENSGRMLLEILLQLNLKNNIRKQKLSTLVHQICLKASFSQAG